MDSMYPPSENVNNAISTLLQNTGGEFYKINWLPIVILSTLILFKIVLLRINSTVQTVMFAI